MRLLPTNLLHRSVSFRFPQAECRQVLGAHAGTEYLQGVRSQGLFYLVPRSSVKHKVVVWSAPALPFRGVARFLATTTHGRIPGSSWQLPTSLRANRCHEPQRRGAPATKNVPFSAEIRRGTSSVTLKMILPRPPGCRPDEQPLSSMKSTPARSRYYLPITAEIRMPCAALHEEPGDGRAAVGKSDIKNRLVAF